MDPSSYTTPHVFEALRRGLKRAIRVDHLSRGEARKRKEEQEDGEKKNKIDKTKEGQQRKERTADKTKEQRRESGGGREEEEEDEGSKKEPPFTVLSLKEDLVQFGGEGSPESVRDRMMQFPQIPVAPSNKGEAIVAMIVSQNPSPSSENDAADSHRHDSREDHEERKLEQEEEEEEQMKFRTAAYPVHGYDHPALVSPPLQ